MILAASSVSGGRGTQPLKPKGVGDGWPCLCTYWSSMISSIMRPSGWFAVCRGTLVVDAAVAAALVCSNWVGGLVALSAEWRPTGMNGED